MLARLHMETWSPRWAPLSLCLGLSALSFACAWTLAQALPPGRGSLLPLTAAALGLAVAAVVSLLVQRLIRTERAAAALTANLTHDLERLALVAEETSDMVVITDAQRRIRWVNEAFEKTTGYSALEVLGRSPGELLQCAETDPATVTQMRVTLDAGLTFRGEVRNRAKDGSLYWLDLLIQPLHDAQGRLDGFMSVQSDVTRRRDMEAQLTRQAALLHAAIDTIDEAFVVYDPDDRLVYCNDRYRLVYASSADLLVPGARFEDIIRIGAQRGQYREAMGRVEEWVAERLASHREPGAPLIQTTDDGRVLKLREHRLPDGHRVGFRVDITDLMQARQAAERADRAKSEFIGNISHELRTPLQSIIGFSELGVHFARDQAELKSMFVDVLDGGRRMLRLVNGLLDVTKIDGTAGSLALRRGDLGELLLQVAHELRPQLAARRLQIRLPQPLPALPALVEPFRLQQVLRNLLANAVRFAPEGSEIDIEALPPGDRGLGLAVRDRGPGVPEDELETIFEPFMQSSRTRSGAGGTGLGLTISRRIMQAHGGRLSAEAAPGGGARFVLMLPTLNQTPEPVPAEAPEAPGAPGAPEPRAAADLVA